MIGLYAVVLLVAFWRNRLRKEQSGSKGFGRNGDDTSLWWRFFGHICLLLLRNQVMRHGAQVTCFGSVRSLFVILCSSFSVRHSLFVILCSSFSVRHSLFVILCSSFSVRHSLFVILCSSFSVRHSLFVILC